MSKSQKFDCGDGTTTSLNSRQLLALLQVPVSSMCFQTYWALRGRKLIEGVQHFNAMYLTERGKAVLADYERKRRGDQT